MNGEFKSSAVATQARVDEAKLDVRAACNRRVWSLQHWAHRQLSIAFDAWRQCLTKAQKGDLKADAIKATSTVEPLSVNTAVADKAVAVEVKFDASIPKADQLNFDAGDKPTASTEGKCKGEADESALMTKLQNFTETGLKIATTLANLSTAAVVVEDTIVEAVVVAEAIAVNSHKAHAQRLRLASLASTSWT